MQLTVAGAIDLAHASGTKGGDDFVRPKRVASTECHGNPGAVALIVVASDSRPATKLSLDQGRPLTWNLATKSPVLPGNWYGRLQESRKNQTFPTAPSPAEGRPVMR